MRTIYTNRKQPYQLPEFNDVKEQVVVSLTTYGQRISRIMTTIKSLQEQSRKPDKIAVYIAFNDEELITDELRNAELVDIRLCEDTKSHKKFNGLWDFPEAYVITADDDLIYKEDWLKVLLQASQINRKAVSAHNTFIMGTSHGFGRTATRKDNRNSLMGTVNFYVMTGAGVCVPPGIDLHELKEAYKYSPYCDEKPLTILLAHKHIPVIATAMNSDPYHKESYKIKGVGGLWEQHNCNAQKERWDQAKIFIKSL